MTAADWSIALALGLAGSLHCTQMCGPLVIAAGGGAASQAAYNAGRIATYSLLGTVAGAAGGVGSLREAERVIAMVCGLLLATAGVWMLGLAPARTLVQIDMDGPVRRMLGKAAPLLLQKSAPARLRMGLLLGFLPCGLVWAALLKAASTGTAPDGAATMFGFGLGTSGALMAIGLFAARIPRLFSRHSTRIAAVTMIASGLFVAWRGINTSADGSCQHVHRHV